MSLVSVGCFKLEVSATGRCLVQSSRTEYGVLRAIEEPRTEGLSPLVLSSHKKKYIYILCCSTQNSFRNIILYKKGVKSDSDKKCCNFELPK
jgi:hypothetical protein